MTITEQALAFVLQTYGRGEHISLTIVTMMAKTGMCRNAVKAARDGLLAKGLIEKIGQQGDADIFRLTLPASSGATAQVSSNDTQVSSNDSRLSSNDSQVSPDDPNISLEKKQPDDLATSTCAGAQDDDVATPSGENQAKASSRPGSSARAGDSSPDDQVPGQEEDIASLEEYVLDLEECVGDIEVRLYGVDDGQIDIKPPAKLLRNLCLRYGYTAKWSDVLRVFPPDDKVWRLSRRKDSPVGYLLRLLELDMIRANKENEADDPEPVDDEITRLVKEYAELTGRAPGDIEHELETTYRALGPGEIVTILQSWINKARIRAGEETA
jgi:hypothetical protein